MKNIKRFLIRNFAEILVILSVICVISGVTGYYREDLDFFSGLYETGRFFLLNHAFQFNAKINVWLEISRWCAILVFLMVSGAIILKVFEEFWTSIKIRRLNNHIIVCGLNKITLNLVEKFEDKKIIVLAEETNLFNNTDTSLDYIPFNINELGIKYGISHGISNILPSKIESPPEILIVGLTEKTEITLLNLAQCLTMKRESFIFTIIEDNKEKIRSFEKKYPYLQNFAEIKYLNQIKPGKKYTSVIIYIENQTEAIKNAISIRYLLCKNEPNILVFCNESDTINEFLKSELTKKRIFTINLFEQIANYVFDLDKNIEEKAKEAHY